MKKRSTLAGFGHVSAAAGLSVAAALLVYLLAIHRWQLNWGATDSEVNRALPGDDLVAQPENQTTRAITIDAPVASVWPWLVQMGQGRGGLYSYEMLENLMGCDIHNADSINAAWQDTSVGDRVRMYPEGSGPPPYTVAEIVPGKALIAGHTTEPGGVPAAVTPQTVWSDTWAFVLEPINEKSTRLLIRSRSTYADPAMNAIMTVVGPGYFIMERGMLFGIKERAERAAGINYASTDGWGAAFLITSLVGLAAFLFVGKWPHKIVIVPVGAALWVLVLFFGHPSPYIPAAVALAAVGALAWNYRSSRTRKVVFSRTVI